MDSRHEGTGHRFNNEHPVGSLFNWYLDMLRQPDCLCGCSWRDHEGKDEHCSNCGRFTCAEYAPKGHAR